MNRPKAAKRTSKDTATLVAYRIARLLVGESWTPVTYQAERERLNSLPGVQIGRLPRDSEFEYSA